MDNEFRNEAQNLEPKTQNLEPKTQNLEPKRLDG
jgi:hypothetical protein